jgi:hypothetical protein
MFLFSPFSNVLGIDKENATLLEDCLPLGQSYESRDALLSSINVWAATRGYAFTTGKSTRGKSSRQTVPYVYGRSYHLQAHRFRDSRRQPLRELAMSSPL